MLFYTLIRDGIDGDGRQWDNVIRGDSMFKINPYRPGAGLMPTYLAGRDEDINRQSRQRQPLCMEYCPSGDSDAPSFPDLLTRDVSSFKKAVSNAFCLNSSSTSSDDVLCLL